MSNIKSPPPEARPQPPPRIHVHHSYGLGSTVHVDGKLLDGVKAWSVEHTPAGSDLVLRVSLKYVAVQHTEVLRVSLEYVAIQPAEVKA